VANLFESLVSLQALLNRAGISSAVIGGVAVGVWGEPRVTRDVDVKVLLGRDNGQITPAAHICQAGRQRSDPGDLAGQLLVA